MSELRQWTKWSVIGFLVVIGLFLLVVVLLNWIAGRGVQKRLQAIRDAGDPVTLADLVPAPVDPAQNAATYLARASSGAEAIERELQPLFEAESYYLPDSLTPTDAGAARARAALDAHPEVIPLLMQAADCKTYASPIDFTADPDAILSLDALLSQLPVNRNAARALQRHAEASIHEGRREDAVQASLAMLRIGRLCEAEPLLVSYLVATAIRGMGCEQIDAAIQSGPISDAARKLIEAELASQDYTTGYESALKTERVYSIAMIRSGDVGPAKITRYMPRFLLNESCTLDLYDMVIPTAAKPRYQVSKELDAIDAETTRTHVYSSRAVAQMLIPALQATRSAADRTQAKVRCLRVLVALQAFLQQQPGATPSLEKLNVPPEATIDPFTGQPLILKQKDDGWLVYSVGENLTDDGGSIADNKDVGAGPVKSQ